MPKRSEADWRRICCPVDFSDCARHATRAALDLARRLGGEVTLLHVYAPPGFALPEGYYIAGPDTLRSVAEAADRALQDWRRDVAEEAGVAVAAALAIGSPAIEIVRFAREGGFDLLVLGTHGRTGLRHALLGSVTEKVVRLAPCPVLTIRHDEHAPA